MAAYFRSRQDLICGLIDLRKTRQGLLITPHFFHRVPVKTLAHYKNKCVWAGQIRRLPLALIGTQGNQDDDTWP